MKFHKVAGSFSLFIAVFFSIIILVFDQSSAQDLSESGTTNHQLAGHLYAKTASDSHQDTSKTHDAGHDAHGAGHADLGPMLPLWSCIPFAGMLLSIALFPLVAPEFWHHHFGKVSAFWAAALGIPFLIAFKGDAVYEILHIILADYVPFIILLWSLYTVSGGILLRGTLRGTPLVNVTILIIGTLLASLTFWYTSRLLLGRDYESFPLPSPYADIGRRWWPRA